MKAQDLEDFISGAAQENSGYAIAYALLKLAHAQERTAVELNRLGLADAATPMGAIEHLSGELKRLADAVEIFAEKSQDHREA